VSSVPPWLTSVDKQSISGTHCDTADDADPGHAAFCISHEFDRLAAVVAVGDDRPVGTEECDRHYRARRLGRNDWIYRGSDDRYYCRRDDGTTGLIIGGISGAVLGHIIAPGGAKTLGTIVGAGTGALIGRAIDEGDVVCH